MSAPALLRGRGLAKRFGPVAALEDVDLELPAGRVVAALGPNGAGKSTLLRILAGLVRPSAGEVALEGAPRDRRRARALVGYVGHQTLLYPALTARENLSFACRLYGVADAAARCAALLAEYDLEAAADRAAGGFSRGMAQRLAIARSLVHDPPVLLLDEPDTGLDRGAGRALGQRIAALREAGRAILLVTHDPLRAAELADSALVLRSGRVASRLAGTALTADALEAALDVAGAPA